MADRWVINASPIILLAKAEVIQLLPSLCDSLVIPAGVVGEVEDVYIADAGKSWLAGPGKRFVCGSPPMHRYSRIGRAEPARLKSFRGHCKIWGFTAVLDDRRARSLATRNAVPVLGSLRVIVLAKERGFIPKAKTALEKLRGAGAYVTDELIDRAISLAGEV